MTISLAMMFGRLGALIGNVVFPYLLQTGCLPPFLLIGLIQFGKLKKFDELIDSPQFNKTKSACSFLCVFLPKTNKTLQ